MRRGPWPNEVIARLLDALDTLVERLRQYDDVVALILFGSYARGEFGRKSDVDLLLLLAGETRPEASETGRSALRVVGEVEAEARLPMHLAVLLASVARVGELGPALLHDVWTDGIVLYGQASALSLLQPQGLVPWVVIRFSVAHLKPHERVRLSRRLHGLSGRPGIVRPPAMVLARGALLVPPEQARAVREALDEVGAIYDLVPVWRET